MSAQEKNRVSLSTISLGSRLNEGGLACIYEAFDREGDRVVVRQLKAEHRFNRHLRHCFSQGVQIRRELGPHPHIVHYLGEGGLLQPFELLEYVPCSNLKQLIFRHDQVVHQHPVCILQQVAEALLLLHEQGWLHLDVKPENILVQTAGERPVVKLTDFDLCQPQGRQTAPRHAGGSLAYLPPEYLSRKEISISTDVFSFGVMAYYLFTRQMPFVGSVSTNMEHGDLKVDFPELQEGPVPECVQSFIRRCLAPLPMHRFCDDNELRIGLKVLARELAKPAATVRSRRGQGH